MDKGEVWAGAVMGAGWVKKNAVPGSVPETA
jgi:hypothetical protein